MPHRHTAGTASWRTFDTPCPTPHPWHPEAIADWGYTPHCLDCGGERYDELHRRQQ